MYTAIKRSSSERNLTPAKAPLNPNATEFVPFSLRSPSAAIISPGASSKFSTFLESSVSINSDNESHKYLPHQLPDDITPDFKVNSLPFSSLSLTDINEGSRYYVNGNSNADKMRLSSCGGDFPSPTGVHPSLGKPWHPQTVSSDGGNSRHSFLDVSNEELFMENSSNQDVVSLDFLASQFPGFAAESLAEVYFANGGDLNLTIEMLAQLELQVDGALNQSINSPKTLASPNLSDIDFPIPSARSSQNDFSKFGDDDIHSNGGSYRSSEKQGALLFRSDPFIPSRGSADFASTMRKMASQDSSIWKYERKELGNSDKPEGTND